MSTTTKLIDTLVADARPVRVVRTGRLLLTWIAANVALGILYLWIVGIRADLLERLHDWQFFAALALWTTAFALSSVWYLAESVPGRMRFSPRQTALMLGALYAGALSLYAGVFGGPTHSHVHAHAHAHAGLGWAETFEALGCCLRITLGITLPALLAVAFVARLAPLDLTRPVVFAQLGAATMVSIVSQLNCPHDETAHILLGHGVMLAMSCSLTYFVYALVARRAYSASVRRRIGEAARARGAV